MSEAQARAQILAMTAAYCDRFLAPKPYAKGQRIAYASRVFDSKELSNLVDSALDFWLTAGRYTEAFENQFSKAVNSAFCSLVNSGSSANLLAFMALTSPLLGERAIRRGDEVITVAAAFPTTVAPVVQFGAVPVLVDVTIPQYNVDTSRLEEALSEKTRAVFLAHTLGNPFDLKAVKQFCDKHRLWLIEDSCDALGSKYTIDGDEKFTGTVGDIGTASFYPAHHITMGEGGAVYTNNPLLHKIIRSMRDWGRDCVCPGGKDNLCGRRFDKQHGELPLGYDHKYVYSHFGYNLKVTDMQAAIGCAQLEKLPAFVERRRHNWQRLSDGLSDVQDRLILPEPAPSSTPSWFGFTLTCKGSAPATRSRLTQFIERSGVQTRALFAGNIVKHPCFDEMRQKGAGYRVVGSLEATDTVLNNTFWLGVYPGMTDEMVDRMVEVVKDGVRHLREA
ncbi:MAG: lipopolysaccharide biosynthesis protein RfbH [Prevotellaceae bacterium]|jgi:CDP-6-deoxy-D-xylo-4-hexulose-3-dehydrase|nr:lipopolysaccharide biosynthesis protein RfbH [Prevotellaceae bacterium]